MHDKVNTVSINYLKSFLNIPGILQPLGRIKHDLCWAESQAKTQTDVPLGNGHFKIRIFWL